MNLPELHMVLKFGIESFWQEKAQNSSTDRDDTVNQHRDGVVVDLKKPDQGCQDACYASTHGI